MSPTSLTSSTRTRTTEVWPSSSTRTSQTTLHSWGRNERPPLVANIRGFEFHFLKIPSCLHFQDNMLTEVFGALKAIEKKNASFPTMSSARLVLSVPRKHQSKDRSWILR